MIPRKSESELQLMREAGRVLAAIMRRLEDFIRPGITTAQVDSLAERLILEAGVLPAFKGYKGFPATACTSVNEEIVHGIPGERTLVEGDIISVDLGINYKGYFSDAAFTAPAGECDGSSRNLIGTAKEALSLGIKEARAGKRLGDISSAIQAHTERNGFSVVREFVGHGIGRELHEEPEVPNFGQPREGALLEAGMVLAIEPMINIGTWQAEILPNGWTAVTKDNRRSAHFEHTVAITEKGPEILTA